MLCHEISNQKGAQPMELKVGAEFIMLWVIEYLCYESGFFTCLPTLK